MVKRELGTKTLEKALEKAINQSYQRASEAQIKSRKALLALGVLALVVIFYGFTQFSGYSAAINLKSSSSSQTSSSASSSITQPTDRFTQSLVASKKDFHPDLSLEKYENLRLVKKENYDMDYKSGQTLEEVIKTLGKASNAYYNTNNTKKFLSVSYSLVDYKDYSDEREFRLGFEKENGVYYLTRKACSGLQDSKYPPLADKNTYVDQWSEDNLNKVVVGDSETGESGSSYEDLVAIGGQPVYSDISNIRDSLTPNRPLEMRISYRKLNPEGKWVGVDYTLKQQKDGVYRVSQMSTD